MINIGGHAHLKGLSLPKLSRSQRMRTMVSASFMCKPPNPDAIPWNTILWSSHVPGYHHPALITPSRDTKQLGTALTPQNLLKLFELDNPRPAHLAWPAPSCRNPNEELGWWRMKNPYLCFPLNPSASWPTLVVACVACHSTFPSLGICEYNKLSLQWQCLLMCWPCHMQIIIKPTF